jgi:hypothetical protein
MAEVKFGINRLLDDLGKYNHNQGRILYNVPYFLHKIIIFCEATCLLSLQYLILLFAVPGSAFWTANPEIHSKFIVQMDHLIPRELRERGNNYVLLFYAKQAAPLI